ncbi:vacuolar ATP synthase subunit C [Encephalitozoon intestinalis ATCC 50506]|uniref:V-type proton ATPase subunit C n=1 Tax=Encephalitozoon intestinalis (strain ATCC 50506) TaxID=876142 RepID=E0S650_ENCIT|nr:vacuolar ATP synthase subunit C [Encephalitozoon intestinalis ATCC 50506]ADM11185.1 vacuolar ATP synthase subunit C [Encephalitozoon intestinalis ATCC 50506]UTX44852.1 vacuolar ATP synthase subunit C [Encephalitozoon intestinalis]
MFVLVGLPVEEDVPQPTEDLIQEDYGVNCSRISLPSFTGVSLEGIVNQVERLNLLEKSCEGLFKTFMGYSRTCRIAKEVECDSIENAGNFLRWDNQNFPTNSIDKAILLLDGEYGRVYKAYEEKVEEFGDARKECEKLQKLTRGSLCDINLNIIVGKAEKYEFLKVLYVVVQKSKSSEFNRVVEDSPHISGDAVEKINSDEDHNLFKIYILHQGEEEVRNMMHSEGFLIKDLDDNMISSEEMITKRRKAEERFSAVERLLTTFLQINLKEVLKILVHVKLLKLFVESVYRYGLPTEYMFFVTSGEKSNILSQWITIAKNWPSDRIVYEEDGDNNEEGEIFFAFSEIEMHREEEE